MVAIALVVLIHLAIGYALITGLAYSAIEQVVQRVTTVDIEEPPPPEEEPPRARREMRHDRSGRACPTPSSSINPNMGGRTEAPGVAFRHLKGLCSRKKVNCK